MRVELSNRARSVSEPQPRSKPINIPQKPHRNSTPDYVVGGPPQDGGILPTHQNNAYAAYEYSGERRNNPFSFFPIQETSQPSAEEQKQPERAISAPTVLQPYTNNHHSAAQDTNNHHSAAQDGPPAWLQFQLQQSSLAWLQLREAEANVKAKTGSVTRTPIPRTEREIAARKRAGLLPNPNSYSTERRTGVPIPCTAGQSAHRRDYRLWQEEEDQLEEKMAGLENKLRDAQTQTTGIPSHLLFRAPESAHSALAREKLIKKLKTQIKEVKEEFRALEKIRPESSDYTDQNFTGPPGYQ